jgi:hypothetical protein
MGGPPKSILAISDLTLGGSTDRADVPIGNAQQSLLQQRDRWFESGSLQRRVCLASAFHAYRRKDPAFARSVSLDVTRERDVLATSRLALAAFL